VNRSFAHSLEVETNSCPIVQHDSGVRQWNAFHFPGALQLLHGETRNGKSLTQNTERFRKVSHSDHQEISCTYNSFMWYIHWVMLIVRYLLQFYLGSAQKTLSVKIQGCGVGDKMSDCHLNKFSTP